MQIFIVLVVVGVALECGKEAVQWATGMISRLRGRSPHDHKFTMMLLGGLLVVIGVAGELAIEVLSHSVETDLRKANDIQAQSLKKEVAVAQRVAESAKQDTYALMNQHEALKKEAALAQASLLDRLRQTESRGQLIYEAKLRDNKKLLEFSGQKINIAWCTNISVYFENKQVVDNLAAELARAKWDVSETTDGCGGIGIYFLYSARADAKTKNAARTLNGVVRKAISHKRIGALTSDELEPTVIRPGFPMDLEPPNSNTVVVFVAGFP